MKSMPNMLIKLYKYNGKINCFSVFKGVINENKTNNEKIVDSYLSNINKNTHVINNINVEGCGFD